MDYIKPSQFGIYRPMIGRYRLEKLIENTHLREFFRFLVVYWGNYIFVVVAWQIVINAGYNVVFYSKNKNQYILYTTILVQSIYILSGLAVGEYVSTIFFEIQIHDFLLFVYFNFRSALMKLFSPE